MRLDATNPISRRTFLASAGTILCAPALGRLSPVFGAERGLVFLAIGDWGEGGSPGQREVAARLSMIAREVSLDFVISLGDNFYMNGVLSTRDSQWQTTFSSVYTDHSLDCPWYVVLGNHDHRGNAQAQIEYSNLSSRWRLPAAYYKESFSIQDDSIADMFFLDTTPMVHVGEDEPGVTKQLRWLDEQLAKSRADWKVVVGHHPMVTGGRHVRSAAVMQRRLFGILDQHRVKVYLSGHDHGLQHLALGNIHQFISAGGSSVYPTSSIKNTIFAEKKLGFMLAMLKRDKIEFTFIDETGAALHRYTISAGE